MLVNLIASSQHGEERGDQDEDDQGDGAFDERLERLRRPTGVGFVHEQEGQAGRGTGNDAGTGDLGEIRRHEQLDSGVVQLPGK